MSGLIKLTFPLDFGCLSVFFLYQIYKNRMEEVIKVNLFGSQKTITKQNLCNLQPILSEQMIRLISFPSWMSSFNLELNVFHSCFYYVLAVEKDIQQSRLISFREKCLTNITEYYVRHKMRFELYEYGYVCCKILRMRIDRAMHIIYFLVYARMASKPFISNQIESMQRNGRQANRTNTMKSRYTCSVRSKENKSRHFTVFYDSSQSQVQTLKKELTNILKPQLSISKKIVKKVDSKPFNQKKIFTYQSAKDIKGTDRFISTVSCRSSKSKMESIVPIKVCNYQNSSIISRLGMKSNINKINKSKKILFRKLNFNQVCDYQVKDQKKSINHQFSKYNYSKDRNTTKIQRNPLKYFQDIANEIKNKNEHLDTVRQECSYAFRNTVSQCRQPRQNDEERIKMANIRKTQMLGNDPYKNINSEKVLRKSSNDTQNHVNIKQNNQQTENYASITRKNENICLYDNNDSNRKIAKRNRVNHYKNQYKHFLTTSLFKRPRDTA